MELQTRQRRGHPERGEASRIDTMHHAWVTSVISGAKGGPSPSARLGMTRVFRL
jgi:hypothetical protein